MGNFIIFMPEKGLTDGRGQTVLSMTEPQQKWAADDNSLDSADLGDFFCYLGDKEVFYNNIRELWRCLKKDAPARLNVPHPQHDLYMSNPEYTRPILPEVLDKFNFELNDKWKALGFQYPRLAHRFGVNFEITEAQMNADPYWQELIQKQQIGSEDMTLASKQALNVVSTMQITWVARKPNTEKNPASQLTSEMADRFRAQIQSYKDAGNPDAAKLIEEMMIQVQKP